MTRRVIVLISSLALAVMAMAQAAFVSDNQVAVF